ncbi:MAG: HlyD family efflux transporter periplasmic adaptor subunit [Brevibacillus sp.]|nr:HlyD family efflux transporter periplasmic adaptor subunit [Brevibacillus sp.]
MQKRFYKTWWFHSAIILLLAVGGWSSYRYFYTPTVPAMTQAVATAVVERGSIQVEVSGSGTLQPTREVVKAPQSGTVKMINFDEGEHVTAGQVLLTYQEEDMSDQINQELLSLEQKKLDLQLLQIEAEERQSDYHITAAESGRVTSLEVEVGDEVSANQVIGTIQDVDTWTLTVPFSTVGIDTIQLGQEADVLLLGSFTRVKGTVKEVDRIGRAAAGGAIVHDVVVEVKGGNALTTDEKAQVTIVTSRGNLTGLESATVAKAPVVEIKAPASGKVSKVLVKKQDQVQEGQLLVQLENKSDEISTTKNMEKIQLEIQEIQKRIESYQEEQATYGPVLSPIAGEVVSMNVDPGSKINAGAEIAEIVNYDELSLVIPVDELDIPKVKPGQQAEVTVDALPDKTFVGEVVEIAKEGVTQNGVSTFDVTIRITDFEGVKPGMTSHAKIIVEKKDDVLLLPVEAIQESQGKKFVLLRPESSAQVDDSSTERNSRSNRSMKQVEVGLHNETHIEVISGVEEGDQVILPSVMSSSGSQRSRGMGEMGGGGMRFIMPGGGGFGGGRGGR